MPTPSRDNEEREMSELNREPQPEVKVAASRQPDPPPVAKPLSIFSLSERVKRLEELAELKS